MRVTIRDSVPGEQNHIVDSWARSFSHFHRHPCKGLATWLWHKVHRAWISDALRNGARAIVAVADEVPDEILGWACYEPADNNHPLTLHYVFVKRVVRRNGIGSALIGAVMQNADQRGVVTTHHTSAGKGFFYAAN